jgi:hypothetical protein
MDVTGGTVLSILRHITTLPENGAPPTSNQILMDRNQQNSNPGYLPMSHVLKTRPLP